MNAIDQMIDKTIRDHLVKRIGVNKRASLRIEKKLAEFVADQRWAAAVKLCREAEYIFEQLRIDSESLQKYQ